MSYVSIVKIKTNWALFLDLDGTLIDIAPTPDEVVVPKELPALLEAVRELLGGALAIVTGRAQETADRLLKPFVASGGFSHGAQLRGVVGNACFADAMPGLPKEWAERLEREVERYQGLLLEHKPHGLALHYRKAPQHEAVARAMLERLLHDQQHSFALLRAHMALEIRPRAATKSRAVEALMSAKPFDGRFPVFVGDDVTDEEGMEAARRHGGMGLHVGRDFIGGPAEVRAWLARGLAHLQRDAAHD